MYTSNTSIKPTSPQKTNDNVAKFAAQVDLVMAVISLSKRAVIWMNGQPSSSWTYLTLYDLMMYFLYDVISGLWVQIPITTTLMLSGSVGCCKKDQPTSLSLYSMLPFPASTLFSLRLFDLLSGFFFRERILIAAFTLFLPLHLHLHLHVRSSALFTKTALVLSSVHAAQPIFLTVFVPTSSFLSISPRDLPFMLGSDTVWCPPPPLCLCCMCFICIRYLPQLNSLLCIRPHEPHPNPLTLCWVLQGCSHWSSHLTEQLAWPQVRPQQRRLMRPIFNAPRCVLSTSAFPLLFMTWVKMQSSMWIEVMHTEEKSPGFQRWVGVISPVVIFLVFHMSCSGNVAWHLLGNTDQTVSGTQS